MPSRRISHRSAVRLGTGLVAALTLALAGCSAGDVEMNGKVFDAIGATGLLGKPVGKVNMAERQALVVPPKLDHLPPPGSGMPAVADATTQVVDPERAKVVNAAELQKRQAAYCKEHYELAKMRGDSHADSATGPAGLCRPSAFSAFENWNKGEPEPEVTETAAEAAATPANTTGSIGTVTEATPPPAAKRGR